MSDGEESSFFAAFYRIPPWPWLLLQACQEIQEVGGNDLKVKKQLLKFNIGNTSSKQYRRFVVNGDALNVNSNQWNYNHQAIDGRLGQNGSSEPEERGKASFFTRLLVSKSDLILGKGES